MRKFEYPKFDFFVSEDIVEDKEKLMAEVDNVLIELGEPAPASQDAEFYLKECIFDEGTVSKIFERREAFRGYLEEYAKYAGKEKFVIVRAHGDDKDGTWVCYDGNRTLKPSKIVSQLSRKYAGVVLSICNPKNSPVRSAKCALMYPDDDIDINPVTSAYNNCGGKFQLYSPIHGLLDSHTIDEAFSDLKHAPRAAEHVPTKHV
jgi:hypothetical protein